MLVCRDWEKAKTDYGFKDTIPPREVYKEINSGGDVHAYIKKETGEFYICVFYEEGSEILNFSDLDFIYDMIKDGVIEKVEE